MFAHQDCSGQGAWVVNRSSGNEEDDEERAKGDCVMLLAAEVTDLDEAEQSLRRMRAVEAKDRKTVSVARIDLSLHISRSRCIRLSSGLLPSPSLPCSFFPPLGSLFPPPHVSPCCCCRKLSSS